MNLELLVATQYNLELRVSLDGNINANQDTDIANNKELQFMVWPINICIATVLIPYDPES